MGKLGGEISVGVPSVVLADARAGVKHPRSVVHWSVS